MNVLNEEEIERIVVSAADLFLTSGIAKTSVAQIAKAAGVGEASVYRHYKTKDRIALKAATLLSERVLLRFDLDGKTTGYERIAAFFDGYEKVFRESPNYFRFLYELDSIYLKGDSDEIALYEESVEKYHHLFLRSYEKGLEDGSVCRIGDVDLFYYSAAHALLNMCKGLSISENPLKQDKSLNRAEEIATLCEMILKTIKKERSL